MKRIIAISAAIIMMLSLPFTANAESKKQTNGDAAPVSLDSYEVLEDNGLAQPGKTYYIPIMYGNYQLHKEEHLQYTYQVSVTNISSSNSKKPASVSLAVVGNYRYVKFSTGASTANQEDQTYLITLDCYDKLATGIKWTNPAEIEITVGFGGSIEFNSDDKYTVDNDAPLVEFADEVEMCDITFPDGSVYRASLVENSKKNKDDGVYRKINLFSSTSPIQSIVNKYPNEKLMFIKFSSGTTFKSGSQLRLYAPNKSFLYSANTYNELTKINFTRSGDFMVFQTDRLGTYVMSDKELPANTSSSSSTSGGPTSMNNTQTVQPSAPLNAAAAGSATDAAIVAGAASVRFTNIDSVPLDAMQTVAAKARTYGKPSVAYFDTLASNGGVDARVTVNPQIVTKAFNATARIDESSVGSVRANFNSWFKNKVAVVWLGEADYGMNVEIAALVNTSDMSNLVFYSYSTSTNRYTQITSPSFWKDGAGYLHFTTRLGNYIIISDGVLTAK